MGKAGVSLTARGVATAKHPGTPSRPVRLGDGGGLYLQIATAGSKSWLIRFTIAGRAREMGLGPVGEAPKGLSLATARQAAAEARGLLRQGIDPIDQRAAELCRSQAERAKSAANSLEQDIQAWLHRLAGADLCDGQEFEPLAVRSIRTRKEQIRNLTSAMVRAGVATASLQTLTDVVIPEHVAKALEFVRSRVGGKWTGQTQNLANLACSIARHYVGAGPKQLQQLALIRRKVSPKRKGMTERNRALLRPFDDPNRTPGPSALANRVT